MKSAAALRAGKRYYDANKALVYERYLAYRLTLKGRLVQTYRNMRNRVEGKTKPHLYAGLPLLDSEAFYAWSLSDPAYLALHGAWTAAGRPLRLAPSVDRIDPSKGYVLGNMRWITQSSNSANTRRHAA